LRFCDEEKIQKNTTADHGSLCVLSQANVSEITTCELFEQTPVGALGVAANILWSGGHLVWRSVVGLLDYSDPKAGRKIRDKLDSLCSELNIQYHDVHLLFPRLTSVSKAHRLAITTNLNWWATSCRKRVGNTCFGSARNPGASTSIMARCGWTEPTSPSPASKPNRPRTRRSGRRRAKFIMNTRRSKASGFRFGMSLSATSSWVDAPP
jgi:hypothetical protein